MIKVLKLEFCLWILFLGISNTISGQSLIDSNLPIVVINTDNKAVISNEPKIGAQMKIVFHKDGSRNYLYDATSPESIEYDNRINIEIRGSSSAQEQNLGKHSYGLETVTKNGEKNNVPLFGMPTEHDWILNANVYDKTLIRNMLSFELSRRMDRYATRTIPCELIINGAYCGVYVFTEKIKRDKGRVDISEMSDTDISGENLTGGYIYKIDKSSGSNSDGWTSVTGFGRYQFDYPSGSNIETQQENFIEDEVDKLERIMNSSSMATWSNPFTGYPSVIDVMSFVDQHILHEMAANLDMLASSMFYSKERNGKIVSGPVWDHDLGYGNSSAYDGFRTDVFMTDRGQSIADGPFYYQKWMFDDMNYRCQLNKRWHELRQPGQALYTKNIMNIIDSLAYRMSESNVREQAKWHTLGRNYWISPAGYAQRTTYTSEIDYLKNWLNIRLVWLDQNLEYDGTCNLDSPPNLVISEIMYHPFGDEGVIDSDEKYEYIELLNAGKDPVQLEGLFFSSGITYVFPKRNLASKEIIVIASDKDSFQKRYGFVPFGQYTRHLSNKNSRLILQTPMGTSIDSVFYTDSAPWPDAETEGKSISLISTDLNNNDSGNWESSIANPGYKLISGTKNTEYLADVEILIYPNPVTDNTFTVQLNSSANNAFFKVFDMQGRKVLDRKVVSRITTFNENLKTGVYILTITNNSSTSRHKLIVK